MAFTPPIFNILADLWNSPHTPAGDLPDVEDQACQFYFTPKGNYFLEPAPFTFFAPPIYLRIPFADQSTWSAFWICEVPPGSGRYFRANWKERVHLGFPNQYLVAVLNQCDANGDAQFHDLPAPPTVVHVASGAGALGVQLLGAGNAGNTTLHASGIGDLEVTVGATGAATH